MKEILRYRLSTDMDDNPIAVYDPEGDFVLQADAEKIQDEVERLIYKERQYEEFKANVFAKAEKFVNKVESGRASSKETYADMKELMETINLLNKEK